MLIATLALVTNVVWECTAFGEMRDWRNHDFSLSIDPYPTQEIVFEFNSKAAGYGNVTWRWDGDREPRSDAIKFIDVTTPGHPMTYRVQPGWLCRGEKVTAIRLTPPCPGGYSHDAWLEQHQLRSLRIEDIRLAKPIEAAEARAVSFRLAATKPGRGRLKWMKEADNEVFETHFQIPPDGQVHEYTLSLEGVRGWKTKIVWAQFVDCEGAPLAVSDVEFSSAPKEIAPTPALMSARAADAFNRVGQSVPVEVVVLNTGTAPLTGVTAFLHRAPEGVGVHDRVAMKEGVEIAPGDIAMITLDVRGLKEGETELKVVVTAANSARKLGAKVPVKILPSLNLPKADYVPEPKPVKSDYEIGAFYFPGWTPAFRKGTAWKAVWQTNPERKPVLGWYDEGEVEAVDWHIKYLAENGISFLMVDWYWERGKMILEHFVRAFQKARYRRHLKWAVHWCNHTGPNSHSFEDMRDVTRFWCTNYFNTAEYYRIDGKPVVMIYSAENLDRDLGEDGCKKALAIAREEAVKAGYPGIYFIAMKWNERDTSERVIRGYADRGFDMTSIYHYIEHDGKVEDPLHFDFSATANANIAQHWENWRKTGIIPFLPHISTGWDDTPWTENRVIRNKNVADFRRICAAAKTFADHYGVKRFVISPLNEWGEGSYCEPNAEFGFGFYEAIRETFCRRPSAGWPLNYTPKDVGLGPYQFKKGNDDHE